MYRFAFLAVLQLLSTYVPGDAMNALSDHQIVSYLDDPNASDNWQDIMPLRDPVLPSVPYSPYCYDAASPGLTNPGIAGTHILTPQSPPKGLYRLQPPAARSVAATDVTSVL
jgi:hypothetical protein